MTAPTPAAVAAHWPVGEVRAVTPLGGGSINAAFRVQAAAGTFHLRVYRDPQRGRAEREHRAVRLARACGLPTPDLSVTREGGTLARLGNHWAALFEVAPGAPVPRSTLHPEHAAGLGALLADLHVRLPGAAPFAVPALAPPADVTTTLARLRAVETAILALPHPDATDGWALARTRQRLAHLRRAPLPDGPCPLARRFVHGDYHDGNVFFSGGAPVSIIDWEQPRLAPRAWEVVRCLHLSLRLDPALGGALLRAYRERLPLPAEELRLGAALYATLQERTVWVYESVYLHGNPGPRAFIRPPPYVPFPQAWASSGMR
ncbi:hypothetical protein GCM10008956_01980 [Deinococcus arenae]|uniref:Aminoglycoside phosphotransferase domain-containing protein n=1 Tax=Deinococcus arenae TaxID=1452751 RepID=A0A8H9GI94_9DEIO|nr:phosphotransferase [Deinococcus arenae]AWT36064.1 hypothetical protein DM785_11195 [Deinococcus actinosclerus]GGM29584.1 hypothetical protein GCM10008956_01980 [Deinococcus arenae]